MEVPAVDVYIAHAGEQKEGFADVLRTLLEQVHQLSVFNEEQSLEIDNPARDLMQTAASAAAVVVVVLSPEFVREKHLMAELSAALARQGCPDGRSQQELCPVFYNLNLEDCSRCDFREQYDRQPWDSFGLTEPKPEPEVLDDYAESIRELCQTVDPRLHQARHYQGFFAMNAVDSVIHCLQALGRLPPNYDLSMPRCCVPDNPRSLLGRKEEELHVLAGLQEKRCVIISGKPGEGKTALAQKVVRDMWEHKDLPGGAYLVNLAGVFENPGSAEMSGGQLSEALADVLLISMHEAEGPFYSHKEGWEAVEACLRAKDNMLILFENAEETQDTPQAREELARALEWLSSFSNAAVLVNSRTDIACGHAEHVRVGQLDDAPAIELLRETSKTPTRQWEPGAPQQLAQLCGHNVLLLVTVGSLVGAGKCTMQEAVSAGELFVRMEEETRNQQTDKKPVSRIRPWLLLYLSKQEQGAMCRLWLFRGSFGQDAATAMLRSGTTPRAPQDTLRCLIASSCLQHVAGPALQCHTGSPPAVSASAPRYSMHPLIGEVFEAEFDRLPGAAQRGILRDFAGLTARRMATLEALKHAGHWLEATMLLADDLQAFQRLRTVLHSSALCGGDARPAAGLRRLMFLGNAVLAELGRAAEAAGRQGGMAELTSAVLRPHHVDMCVSDISVAGADLDLPARLYRPAPRDGQCLSALVYFHGGGFVAGGLDSHDGVCRALANGVPCVVISVAYRLAPEHPFPAAPEDCYAATQWVAARTEELGAGSGLVAVAGDSAGANLAASVAILARDRQGPKLAFQLMYYPCVDGRVGMPDAVGAYPSYAEFGPGSEAVLTTADAGAFMSMYKPAVGDTRWGVLDADLSGLPPALTITAGVDFLRDECRAYTEKLQAAGVPAALKQFDRAFHAFLHYGVPETLEAMDASVQALRAAFGVHDASPLSWAAFFGGSSVEYGSV